MLPKAVLSSHSRMSGSRWVITASCYLSQIIIWVIKIFFVSSILCILVTSSKYLLLMLGPYCFAPLLYPPFHEIYSFFQIIFHYRALLFIYSTYSSSIQFSRVRLFATPWTTAHQASLSVTNSRSPPKPMSIVSVLPSNHLILCRPLLLLPPIPPSNRVFSNESALCIRWPKYWSFSISPSNEHPGLISFRMDWLDLLAVQWTLKSLLQHHSSKASILLHSAFFIVQLSHPYVTTGKTIALGSRQMISLLIRRRKEMWRRRCMKTEAEIGVMQTQAKGSWERPGRASPLESLEGAWPCQHLGFRLVASRTLRENFSVVLHHKQMWSFVAADTGNWYRVGWQILQLVKFLSIPNLAHCLVH